MPVLIGAAGIGVEAGFWQYRQRTLQHLADAAAYGGAVELLASGTPSRAEQVALQEVASGDFEESIGAAEAHAPPPSGPFANADAVLVTLQETWPRYFSALFLASDVTVRASATARAERDICVLALHPSAASALSFAGGSRSDTECALAANSTSASALAASGSADVTASCAYSGGGFTGSLTLTQCASPRVAAGATPDPLAQLPDPPISGNCINPSNFGGASGAVHQVNPGRYCGMTISRTANLGPGVYVIDGGRLRITSTASVNGAGVMFYLTNGATVEINGGASTELSAPTSGAYAGVLFFADRVGAPVIHDVRGGANSRLNGAVYLPNDRVVFSGNGSLATDCTQIVAREIEFTGRSQLRIANCPVRIGRIVRLVL